MDIFAFEPLHNLHLGISKQLKRCIYDRMLHNRHRTIILNACNDLLALYQKDSYVKDLQFNYTSSEKGKRVNGIFTNEGDVRLLHIQALKRNTDEESHLAN